jgi:hypothetical protein
MNEQEARLKQLDGPSSTTKARQKRYVTDSAYRALVDKADRENGTTDGPWLRAGYFGTKQLEAAAPVAQPSAVQLAAACKEYPRKRCYDLFKRPANEPGESSKELTKEQYAEAKLAAQFFKILDPDNTSSVRFNYATSRDRAAKREEKESAARTAAQREADFTPPGIERRPNGEILLVDEAAFTNYKREKAEHSEAVKFLEEAGGAE